MLSKKAVKYLRFLSKHTEYRFYYELEKDYKKVGFDEQCFWAIYDFKMLDINPDCDLPRNREAKRKFLKENVQFRINDAGFAYLDSVSWKRWEEIRAWMAIIISCIAAAISIMSFLR